MIKIEFPADRADIALAVSVALQQIATGMAGAQISLAGRLQQAELDHKHPGAVQPAATVVQTAAGHVNTQTGEVIELELPANPGDAQRLDMKGVPFDARYCANAGDPFYASGKKSGQWKCKRGVDEGVYDTWYAQQLQQPAHTMQANKAAGEDVDHTPVTNTGAAFGATVSTAGPVLRTAGELMAWVSEKQTAGKLTQEAINAAYAQLGIRVQDLFPPTPDHVVANNISALYNFLSPFAGA